MPSDLPPFALPLFVPADRPERFAKALASGADAAILDLEDAVAPERRAEARDMLAAARDTIAGAGVPVIVRINAMGTGDHAADIDVVKALPVAAVMLAKAEDPGTLSDVSRETAKPVVALVESARGIAKAREIAQVAARLAFGSFDFAADLGCRHARDALLLARLELVLASRLGQRPGPLDGVTAAVSDSAATEDDASYAASLGFAGKLLIHPAQVSPARRGFMPGEAEIAWARRVIETSGGGGAVRVDGEMIDAPVRLRASAILARSRASETGGQP